MPKPEIKTKTRETRPDQTLTYGLSSDLWIDLEARLDSCVHLRPTAKPRTRTEWRAEVLEPAGSSRIW